MYHTMFPSQMMAPMMNGQQPGGQFTPVQAHNLHFNGTMNTNVLYPPNFVQYNQNASGHSRHRAMQAGVRPVDLLRLLGVDVSSLRHVNYMQSNNNLYFANWLKRMSAFRDIPVLNMSQCNRPMNNNIMRKPNWVKKKSYRNSFSKNEAQNSDSGFSSCSSTSNRYQSSLTEGSDEQDFTNSSGRHEKHEMCSAYTVSRSRSRTEEMTLEEAFLWEYMEYYSHWDRWRYGGSLDVFTFRNCRTCMKKHERGNFPANGRIFHKIFINPDKYLAESHLVEITSTPLNLVTGSKQWDDLSRQIWSEFMSHQQTESTYRNKIMLWKDLQRHIKKICPRYDFIMIGSTMNGFGLENSDVDMSLLIRHEQVDNRETSLKHLKQAINILQKYKFVENLELIQARVPIISFYESRKNLKVDINCNSTISILNTYLLYYYSKLDWRVKPLVLIVKLWAQYHNINSAKNNTMSSYSLVLMVIHFLQCGVKPRILPNLHYDFYKEFNEFFYKDIQPIIENLHKKNIRSRYEEEDISFHSSNEQSVGELLVEFFKYYTVFDFNKYVVAVDAGCLIKKYHVRSANYPNNEPIHWKYMGIEEPFDHTNTAKAVNKKSTFDRIMYIIGMTFCRLRDTRDLSVIFTEIPEQSIRSTEEDNRDYFNPYLNIQGTEV